eukprot:CAMPEP_0175589600 /NCGR_PEP_ID=MMETSP0096-20121207/51897_1 /TAXON_ID=311494 /ORGANISM="Alexandrium monilatum, Strain CCMP3105" /LENGTH=65 /DNA_ID=CAMNT_0016893631 /DNA_START=25 /DNA_END=218 /DNA_ORIENTATION=-
MTAMLSAPATSPRARSSPTCRENTSAPPTQALLREVRLKSTSQARGACLGLGRSCDSALQAMAVR